jgi:steroid 5-alpha reductase family enzyme
LKGGAEMKNLSTSTYFGLFILSCMLAAMVSIAVMQVVRTVEDVGPMIYIIGGAVALVGILIPLMMVIMIKHLQKERE